MARGRARAFSGQSEFYLCDLGQAPGLLSLKLPYLQNGHEAAENHRVVSL